MALVVKDRVQVTTATTGTGTLTLGSAVTGFQDFSSIGNANTTYYAILSNGSWEVGIGTYTSSGTTLSRDTVLASSGGGSKISLTGTSNVFVTYPSGKALFNDRTLTINGVAYDLSADRSWTVGLALQAVQTTSFTASASKLYPVNTTSGAVTMTLPASPTAGDTVGFIDYAGTFATNKFLINLNGSKLNGATTDVYVAANREAITYVYVDSTQGWLAQSGYADTIPSPATYSSSYLAIAGGGGGGGGSAGGGGAGGYQAGTFTLRIGTVYTATVGGGGAGATSASGALTSIDGATGSNSVISGSNITTVTALGGGGGGIGAGLSGGSGGGGCGWGSGAGGNGTSGQGNNGGQGYDSNVNVRRGGGGGGAGATGASGSASGNGGSGSASSITGSSVTYAGGGGGGAFFTYSAAGSGGSGGGGAGANNGGGGTSGTANLGGGGGGSGTSGSPTVGTGGNGGSGVVIISVPTANYSGTVTGSPTVTTSGSNTIIKFTSSGTYTG